MDDNKESFRIKMFHYIEGQLHVMVEIFDSLEDAIEHGLKSLCHSFKIFDHDGQLCHSHDHDHDHDHYA